MKELNRVRLVKAREENAGRLADISRRAFNSDVDCGAPAEGGPPGYDSPAAQASFMRSCDYYEIHYDETLVGAVMVLKQQDRQYECCGLFVDPTYHDRGIATGAFELLWEAYPDAKLWTVGTPAWNERTNHFYSRLGFVKVGTDGADGVIFEKRMG
jgi:GNAT superfamily N-acetyltransferase